MLFLCSSSFKIKSCIFYYPCFLIFTTIGIWESHRAVCHSTGEKKSLEWPCMGRFPENHIQYYREYTEGCSMWIGWLGTQTQIYQCSIASPRSDNRGSSTVASRWLNSTNTAHYILFLAAPLFMSPPLPIFMPCLFYSSHLKHSNSEN